MANIVFPILQLRKHVFPILQLRKQTSERSGMSFNVLSGKAGIGGGGGLGGSWVPQVVGRHLLARH